MFLHARTTPAANVIEISPEFQAYRHRGAMCVEVLISNLMAPAATKRFAESISQFIERVDDRRFVLDMFHVEWMCSLMLGELISLRKKLLRKEAVMVLIGLRPELRQILTVTRLDEKMPIFADLESVVWTKT